MNATINYTELVYALRPEIALTIGLLLVLGYDMAFGRRMTECVRRYVAVFIGLVTLGSAVFQTLYTPVPHMGVEIWFHGAFVYDILAHAVRLGVFVLSAITLLLVAGSTSKQLRHPAEYVAIQLLATMGFSLMAVSNNLLTAFLGFELASISLYILAGFDKTSRASAEAGLKYFLFGGMAAAFMLFGFSLIYGLTGSITFSEIARSLGVQHLSPLLLVALVMVLVGFGYKAAAAPFHFWAPDVYQGAPTPASALIASASKLAGFAFFARLLYSGLGYVAGEALVFGRTHFIGWISVLVVISAASMLLGNIAALAQSNVRRLIAYSAIAHAGIMLLAVIAISGGGGAGPLYYYALTYGIATIGIFGVFAAIERSAPCQRISDLAGLWKRSPFLAGVLFICVLSLAGVPPLAGFFGKFYVFAAALAMDGLGGLAGWLAILAIALSAVGLYYYLVILKAALVTSPGESSAEKIRTPLSTAVTLVIICALTIALGIYPDLILNLFR